MMQCFSLPIPSGNAKAADAVLECYVLDMSPKIRWKARPAVLICPGGAYYFTNDRESEPMATAFLSRGFHVFSLRYSVEKGIYPTALHELARAVLLLRQHAQEWNIDTERIILAGFSAGGHLAAEFCCKWSEAQLCEALDAPPEALKPNALLLGYPVITAREYTHELSIENLLGDSDSPEARRAASAELHVSSAVPPTFIWHTRTDEMVPVQNSLLFAQALTVCQVPYELHIYPFGVHGLGLANRCTLEADKHDNHYCGKWLAEADAFLNHYLNLEE